MTVSSKQLTAAGITLAVAAIIAAVAFGGRLEKPICPKVRPEYALTGETSESDQALTAQAAPLVASRLAERSADTCAAITTAIATNRPEADLATERLALEPRARKASDRRPYVHDMTKNANAFLTRTFVEKAKATEPTRYSPFLNTLVQLAGQYKAARLRPTVIFYVGDGIAIESGPRGAIDFRMSVPPADERQRLSAFKNGLEPLRGATVVILGFGANSDLGPERIHHAEAALRTALGAAGVKLVVTRSVTIPDWV